MRVKEIDRTANLAWSPENKYPLYVATGTAAQQLDATFSTASAVELYSLNLDEATLDMPLAASVNCDVRFHKLLWGAQADTESGVIIGGGENGGIYIYSADKMLSGAEDCLSRKLERHTGAVKALDVNPFQSNLLASGATDSEIYIWDLLKTESPMTPGQKSLPPEELACVAWNRQVQHILGSTFGSRCVVWDLRKNEPIIKISDSMSRIKAKLLAWHPDVATQLCLSSEDDHTPVIQLWDLRYATTPLKVLENHQKGVLSVAWCQRDPDLLLSCGKDSRILCWNPNSNHPNGEVVYELSTNNQWCFDIQWCPRNPSIISSASFDGHITLYSLMGGGHPIQPSNKVAESFSGAQFDSAPVQVPHEQEKVMPLQKPPKWIRKPVGASFAFGGKLVSFTLEKAPGGGQPTQAARTVTISQVVTETELVARSNQLEQALTGGQFPEFCAMKAANADAFQENFWNFMKVNFENEPRTKFLHLLGYDQNELAKKVVEHTGTEVSAASSRGVDAQELAQKMSLLNTGNVMKADRLVASGQASPSMESKTPIDNLDEAGDVSTAFDNIGNQQNGTGMETPLIIPTDNADGLLTQALLTGNFEAAVEMCLSEDRMAEAILLAIAGGPELLIRTQKKYFVQNKSSLGRLISSVVTHDWAHIVDTCDLDNWKEALAVILTYALPEEFSALCDALAERLEKERNGELSLFASLCYICSGNIDKLVDNWVSNNKSDGTKPLALQDLVEKVMILRKAVELSGGSIPTVSGGALAEKLSQYSSLLAAQGSLATALSYLHNSTDVSLTILQDRLCQALGPKSGSSVLPHVNVQPQGVQQSAPQQTAQRSMGYQSTGTSGQFQTTTIYSSVYQGGSGQYNNTVSAPKMMTPQPMPAVTTPISSAHKGLSHRYPHYPAQTSAYGVETYSPSANTTGYAQPDIYGGSSYPATSMAANSGMSNNPPNLYTPNSGGVAPPNNVYTPTSMAAPYTPPAPAPHPPTGPAVLSYQDKPAENAWNDPPIVKEKPRAATNMQYEQPANMFIPQAPADPGPPGAPANTGLYKPTHQQAPVNAMPSGPHPNTFTGYNPMTPSQPPVSGTLGPKQHQPAAPAEPVQPVVKGPIPSEHQVLHDILDKLVKSCAQTAPNAQMKRKLEDVTRKLEILYDKLRENKLSQSVTLGLHQIVQSIQQYDYTTGLNLYTGLVTQGNFSEISNFMPAIKVLLQSAAQMQVYVQ